MKCLIVQKKWLDKILDEGKTWEMRSTKTKVRGQIGLIEAGSGKIVGEAFLSGCFNSPVLKTEYFIKYHKIEDLTLLDRWPYAWTLIGSKRYSKPIPYTHPRGAVIWVNVDDELFLK